MKGLDQEDIPKIEIKDEYIWYTKFRRELVFKIIKDTNEPLCALVYMTLLSHKNAKQDSSYPSMELLKKELHIGRTNILKYITLLSNYGYIEIKKDKIGSCNHYFFNVEKEIEKIESKDNDYDNPFETDWHYNFYVLYLS